MDCKRIYTLIEEHRPLAEYSAFPFPMIRNTNMIICWFNFFIKEESDLIKVEVSHIFIMTESYNIQKILARNIGMLLHSEYDNSALTEYEYYHEVFYDIYQSNEKAVFELLQKTEMATLLPIYKIIIQKIRSEYNMS